LFKTTDGGANWIQVSKTIIAPSLAIDAGDPPAVYAAGNALMKSADGGQTWTGAGLVDKFVSSVTASRTSSPILYAGTRDGHVYRTTDGGDSWTELADGLTRAAVLRLSVDASGDHLYAATNAGVYEYHFVNDNTLIEPLSDDSLRLPRLLDQLLGSTALSDSSAAFVLPIVGRVTGVRGNLFATKVTLTNDRAVKQDVLLAWLPQAYAGKVSSFRLTLPAASAGSAGAIDIADVAARLGISGIGSLAVFAIDATGDNLDANASVGGSSRIWVRPADRRAPFSQSIPAVRSTLISDHARATAADLRNDSAFRTNVGIANLSASVHQFTVQINGERASGQFTVAVPPFSLMQWPIPNADYGALSLVVFADTSTRWLFYGSTIDNTTGEARTTVGLPSGAR
jgi:hypothetical protein